jgi:hypothetical protein
MKKTLLAIFTILMVIAISQPLFSQLIYISTIDPINKNIEELQSKGYLKGLSQTERPWVVSDVANAILDDELQFDPVSKKIAENILAYLEPPQRNEKEMITAGTNFGLELRGLARENRDGYSYQRDIFINRNYKRELGSVYHGRIWLSKEARWGMDTELIFDSDGTHYPWYYGIPHRARIIGQFDHAYINFNADKFSFLFGRQRLVWGPSPRGSLLLNDSSPPIDMLQYGFTFEPFTLSGFASRLDDYFDPQTDLWNRRFLSGHRLRLNPGKGWEFAISELFLYGGPDRLPELYYNIPIVLYYWEAQNRKLDDNAFWAAEASWQKPKLGRFYTQIVFDDIQRQHRGPQKIAAQFGTYLSPSGLPGWSGLFELNIVDTYVYGQRKRVNAYLNYDQIISRLDSDQREYFAGIYKRMNSDLKLGVEFVGRDKGEYDAADLQPNMAPFDVKFPSGVVEKTKNVSFTFNIQQFTRFYCDARVGYQSIRNFNHESGHSIDQMIANIQLSYSIGLGIPFWKKFQ